ncbi:MAG: PilZ domain-containing protein [bacterium]
MEDRRKAERRVAEGDLIVFDRRADQPLGRIRDLTTHGVMLRCTAPMEQGKTYHCRLALPEEILGWTEIKFQFECKWSRPVPGSQESEAGFEFQGLGKKDQLIIALLIAPWDAAECAQAVLAEADALDE